MVAFNSGHENTSHRFPMKILYLPWTPVGRCLWLWAGIRMFIYFRPQLSGREECWIGCYTGCWMGLTLANEVFGHWPFFFHPFHSDFGKYLLYCFTTTCSWSFLKDISDTADCIINRINLQLEPNGKGKNIKSGLGATASELSLWSTGLLPYSSERGGWSRPRRCNIRPLGWNSMYSRVFVPSHIA